MRNLHLSIFTAATLAATPVFAQEAAQIDATASLSPSESSLAISPANNLRFGRVAIPNRSQGDAISCGYALFFADGGRTLQAQRFENGNMAAPPAAGPTLSGCEYLDSQQSHGLFTVGCAPDSPVDFVLRYRNTALPGIAFEQGENLIPFRFFEAGDNAPLISIFSPVLTLDGGTASDVPCPAGGIIDVVVGGVLDVTVDADPGEDLQVGTIEVAVNY